MATPLARPTEVALCPGDVILFYSDGMTEAVGPEGDMFGADFDSQKELIENFFNEPAVPYEIKDFPDEDR